MQFTCESCRATLHIADEKVKGKRLVVRCKRCGTKIGIADPALSAAAASRPAPAAAPQQKAMGSDSDTESTRAMDSSVLEEALRASKAAGEESAARAAASAPLPPRDPAVWFAMIGGKQVGPVPRAELGLKTAQGAIGPRTYVWRDGMGAWQRAKEVAELSMLFTDAPAAPRQPAAPAPAPVAAPAPTPAVAARAPRAAAVGSNFREFSAQDLDPAVPPPGANAQPAKKPHDISIEGYKPIRVARPAEPTKVESLPLGERVHQERVASELFTPGNDNGASAADLARWASEELAPKRNAAGADGTSQGGSSSDRPAAPAPARISSAPGRAAGPSFAAQAGSTAGRRTLLFAMAIIAVAAVVLLAVFGLGSDQPPATPKTEVASPVKQGSGGADSAKAAAAAADKSPKSDAPVGLSRDVFERIVSESQPAYKPCVDEALRRNPKMRLGKVLISVKIASSGKVIDAAMDRKEAEQSPLGQCLLRTTRRILFPAFQGDVVPGVIPLRINDE